VLLCALGGVLGILAGYGAAAEFHRFMGGDVGGCDVDLVAFTLRGDRAIFGLAGARAGAGIPIEAFEV